MDRAHRDRVAFVRICSGKMTRGMKVRHVRSGRDVRLANPTQFLARERAVVEDGFAGDVVGVHDPGTFEIGDTLTGGSSFVFEPIPSFAPEHFARLALVDPLRRKQFARGVEQLAQEGTVQLYRPPAGRAGDLVLGALGQLQFEVVRYRLEAEYGVEVRLEPVPYQLARWVSRADGAPLDLDALHGAVEGLVVLDFRERAVVLFDREWALRTAERFHPELRFAETATGVVVRAA
jgi:peptide chain release factor 3